jgi:hypothetical protein
MRDNELEQKEICTLSRESSGPHLSGGLIHKAVNHPLYSTLTGDPSVKVCAAPFSCTHSVNGSCPTCSFVAVPTLVTVPGTVSGMVAPQFLFAASTVTAVMVLRSLERVYFKEGEH